MASIQDYLNQIKNAIYGKDVRQAIHDGILQCYLDASGDHYERLDRNKVNQPLDGNNQPTNGTSGQLLRTKGNGATEWSDVGLPTDEQTAQAVSDWLDEHPEATTTVQDGSLTEAKFSDALKLKTIKDYVTPEMFGAKGDGVADDTDAINTAIATGKTVLAFGTYKVTDEIVIGTPSNVVFYGKITNTNNAAAAIKVASNSVALYIKELESAGYGIVLDGTESIYNCEINISKCVSYNSAIYANITSGWVQYCAFYGWYVSTNADALNVSVTPSGSGGWFNENTFSSVRFQAAQSYGVYLTGSVNEVIDANYFDNCSVEGSSKAVYGNNITRTIFNSLRIEELSIVGGYTYKCIELNGVGAENYFYNIYMYANAIDNNSSNNSAFLTGKLLRNDGTPAFKELELKKNNIVASAIYYEEVSNKTLNILNQSYTIPSSLGINNIPYDVYIVNDTTIIIPDAYFVSGKITLTKGLNRYSKFSGVTVKKQSTEAVVASIPNDGTDKRLFVTMRVVNENVIFS